MPLPVPNVVFLAIILVVLAVSARRARKQQ
jgi:hypothetical protein